MLRAITRKHQGALDDVKRLLSANYVKLVAHRATHRGRAPAIAEHIPIALQDALNRVIKPDQC